MTHARRAYHQVVNKYRCPSTHPKGLAAVPFLETLLSVNSEKLCVCSPFSSSSSKQVTVNHFSISPDQPGCLELISLWTGQKFWKCHNFYCLCLQKAIRTARQDENVVVALLVPAYSCWTNKLTSKARGCINTELNSQLKWPLGRGTDCCCYYLKSLHYKSIGKLHKSIQVRARQVNTPIYSLLALPATISGLHS